MGDRRRVATHDGEAPSIPTTAYALLGLLTWREMSGYDVARVVHESVGFFWSPAKSQIYSELRRLVAVGYASERVVLQSDRPDKRLYRITRAGRRALVAWLEAPGTEPDVFRSALMVKVFFGQHMRPEALAREVARVRRESRDRLATFRAIERDIAGKEEFRYPYLTLRAGLLHEEARVKWATEVLRTLEREEGR